MKVVTSAEMQALDRETIEDFGIPGLILMEKAGLGVYSFMMKHFPLETQKGVAVVAGPGNNGGDGFVVARLLHHHGQRVKVFILSPREKFKGDALTNLEIIERLGVDHTYLTGEDEIEGFHNTLKGYGVVVDAIFGTGLSRAVGGRFLRAIEAINRGDARVVAIDIASGISSDDGSILGTAVEADLTVTMALPKLGHVLPPGAFHTGILEVVDIGIPKAAINDQDIKGEILTQEGIKSKLKERPPWGHKGTFGHLLIVSGSRGKTGASALCAMGALGVGPGLITIASPTSSQETISKIAPVEAMTLWLDCDEESGEVTESAIYQLEEGLKGKKAAVVGPGLGLGTRSRKVQEWLMKNAEAPMVVDADALTTLSQDISPIKDAKGPRVLTPHPGEMARLLGCTTKEVQGARLDHALSLARELGAIIVLTGAYTVIASPAGRFSIDPTANPAMGQGGMGDTLSGMIGGLLAQGYDPFHAAQIGVYLHSQSAKMLTQSRGPVGFSASELARNLPCVWRQLIG